MGVNAGRSSGGSKVDLSRRGAGRPYKILGVEFAPLSMPVERRLQTLAVMFYVGMFVIIPIFSVTVPIYLFLCTRFWWVSVMYAVWFWYDRNAPKTGGRPTDFIRKSRIWQYFADYFPIQLHKTVDLDPTRNYIFGYHPHGIISMGCFANFGSDATGFSEKFPGLKTHPCTLVGNFWFPFRREYVIAAGCIDVSKESLRYCLTKMGTGGNAVIIVVGGAMEALEAHPGRYRLHLKRRKGFVRMALQTGADLVPVFTFGENETFDQVDNPDGSIVRKFQVWFKNYCGFSPPVFSGRGVFNYSFGLLPFRRPMSTVVGKPIRVEQALVDPSQELIDEVHKKYCNGLVELFEANKTKYGLSEDAHIELL